MPVPSSLADISTTAASNSPAGADAVGTSLDDYLRTIQAIIKRENSKGSDITASTTIDVPADGSYFVVTGNTTIAGISDDWNGRLVVLKFSGTPQLTHSSGFILPGSANITVAAGDCLSVVNESTGVWRVVEYQPAAGNLKPADIGVTVQGYDADTAKIDVANTWTQTQTLGAGASLVFEGTTADDYEGTLSSSDVTADRTWSLPDKSGIVAMTSDISSSGITLGTAVSLTTQTSIDYTGLPAGIKRLTISFQGVSTNGTDRWLVQIGNTTFTTSGYVGHANSGAGIVANSSGFEINNNVVAANNHSGQIVITKVDTNTYAQSGIVASQTVTNSLATSAGSIALGSELERVRITTTGGTNQFDAGKINISYE